MNKNIGIIGGDLRIIKLAEMLANDNYSVWTYGLEKNKFLNNIIKCENINELQHNCDNIISGIPFSKDNYTIYAPYSEQQLIIEEIIERLKNKTIIAGVIKEDVELIAQKNNIKFIDVMNDEMLTILNVIPTVEGAIQIAMENTEITIHDSNCLILGFGRIGKLLARKLNLLGASISCMARKEKDLAWIEVCGYKGIHLKELDKNLKNYDIIFNTVPEVLLDAEKLKIIKNEETLIIDLASKPGGVDALAAKEYNINLIQALGLPGKVAPLTAAKYIKKTLEKILN